MLWNYKTFHFAPKMRQMMYPDCKTTPKMILELQHLKRHVLRATHFKTCELFSLYGQMSFTANGNVRFTSL